MEREKLNEQEFNTIMAGGTLPPREGDELKPEQPAQNHDQAGQATAQTARTYPARIGLSSGGPPNKDHSTIVMNGLAGRLKSLYSMLAHFGLPLNR